MDSPMTRLGGPAVGLSGPLIIKPRHGSDSIGVRLVAEPPIPTRMQTDDYIVQSYIRGAELSVALICGPSRYAAARSSTGGNTLFLPA